MIFCIFDKDRKINDVVKQIRKYFDFLYDRGFETTYKFYDRKAFGNWIVILRSEKYFIRFVQDRGAIFLQIGPRWGLQELKSSNLTDVDVLVPYIKTRDFDFHIRSISEDKNEQLQRLRLLFLDNFDEIFAFMSRANFDEEKTKITRLVREKFESAYPSLKGNLLTRSKH